MEPRQLLSGVDAGNSLLLPPGIPSDDVITADPVAIIQVSGDFVTIENGSVLTSPDNLTDFGTIWQYGDEVTHTFNVTNNGLADLEIFSIQVPDGFVINSDYSRIIEPGATGGFSVTMLSQEAGFSYDDVVITSNAAKDSEFTFAISGEVMEVGRLQFDSTTPASGRTLIDEQGNTVVFKLAGPGSGTVYFDPDTGELLTLEVDGTKRTSGLTIDVTKTKGEGTGVSAINDVFIQGQLGYFNAGKVDLDGDFVAYGALNSVVLNDIDGGDQQYLYVGGATNTKTSLTFGRIADLVLDISGHISNFTAIEWLDTDCSRDIVYAGSIGTFNITGRKAGSGIQALAGDMSANMKVYNTGVPSGRPTVGSIVVAGEVFDSNWYLYGNTNSIKLGAADSLDLITEDGLGTLTVVGEALEMNVLAGYPLEIGIDGEYNRCGCIPQFIGAAINSVNVGHWIGGTLLADSIKSINITGTPKIGSTPARAGEVYDLLVGINGQEVADNAFALGTLNVTGEAILLDVFVDGNVNKISLNDAEMSDFDISGKINTFTSPGLMFDVWLYAGEGAGTVQAGEWIEGVIEVQTLKSLNITGRGAAGAANKLDGDLLVDLVVFGTVQPNNTTTVGSIKVAGTVLGHEHIHDDHGHGEHDHDGHDHNHGHDHGDEHDHDGEHGHGDDDHNHDAHNHRDHSHDNHGHDGDDHQEHSHNEDEEDGHGHTGSDHDHEDDHGHEHAHNHGHVGEYDDHFDHYDWEIRGSVGSITVGAIDGATFLFDRYYGTKNATKVNSFKAGTVHDTIIDAHGVEFGSINTINWIEGHIHTGKVGSLTTRGQAKVGSTPAILGDFIAHVVIGDPESTLPIPSGNMLGSINIAGVLEDASISVIGNVGSATFGDVHNSGFTSRGNMNSLVSKNGFEESLLAVANKLSSFRAKDISQGVVSAGTIGTINITNNVLAEINSFSTDGSKSAVGIGSLTVGGVIMSSVITSNLNVNSIRAGAVVESTVFVGVSSLVPTDELPTSKLQFSNPAAVLGSFQVTGAVLPPGTDTFILSRVAAGVLSNVNVKLVGSLIEEGQGLTGFSAASKIGSYRRLKLVEGKTQPVVVTNKTVPGTYDTDGINYVLVVADMLDEAVG